MKEWLRLCPWLLLALTCHASHDFYVPGEKPRSYEKGEEVKLEVNKLTSTKVLLTKDYYRLPFCRPVYGPQMEQESLGELLEGDRIKSTTYSLFMLQDMYCEHLCVSNMDLDEKIMAKAIKDEYHNNWIVDNLPAASKMEDDWYITTLYWQGFPIGFVGKDGLAYIHNHVNIEIMYHPLDDNKFHVVRVVVEPFSIRHEMDQWSRVIIDPIPIESCQKDSRRHTTYEMVTEGNHEAQVASGKVLFTYDVIWTENKDLKWASRWDIYLSMDHAIPAQVHWFSIANSLITMIALSVKIAFILLRNLRTRTAEYNAVATNQRDTNDDELMEQSGWKLMYGYICCPPSKREIYVQGDIFRPPSSPLLFSVYCGTGAQLLVTAFATITLGAMGILNASRRGSLLIAALVLYALTGVVGGYVTARLYKAFKGLSPRRASLYTALGFPALCFLVFVLLDLQACWKRSTAAVPFTSMLVLLGLWFGVSTPLVFLGAFFGNNQDAIVFPVNPSITVPPTAPDQLGDKKFKGLLFTVLPLILGGFAPFSAILVENYFILASVWMGYYYYAFGFLLLVFVIVLITCAEVSILFIYIQLCYDEEPEWWWPSLGAGGSIAIYTFSYAMFTNLEELEAHTDAQSRLLYFGYTALSSAGLFLMTGSVGVASTLWFNRVIFASGVEREDRVELGRLNG